MTTRIDAICDGIYRISTFVPNIAPPAGFTFNQFLVDADEPPSAGLTGDPEARAACSPRSRRR